jgi:flagellar motor protein MotB
VAKLDTEGLKKRLEFSERKRTLLQKMVARTHGAEDTLLVTVADLMTLLLTFFVLFYSRTLNFKPVPAVTNHNQVTKLVLDIEKSSTWTELPKRVASRNSSPEAVKEGANANNTQPVHYGDTLDHAHAPDVSTPPHAMQNADTTDSLERLKQEVLNSLNPTDERNFYVRLDRQRLVLVLGERITFIVGEAELLESFKPTLTQVAALIAAKRGYRVVVAGHTDDTPIYTVRFPSNWELSATRAVNVVKFLATHGVDPCRMSISGHAEYQPLYENTTAENRQRNRRVEISLIRE